MPPPGKNPAEPFFNPYGLNDSMITLVGMPAPPGGGPNNFPPYRIGTSGQLTQLILLAGLPQSKIIPGSAGLTIRNNADTLDAFVVDQNGIATIGATGALVNQSLSINTTVPASYVQDVATKTAIPDTTATSIARFTVPNAITSISGTIILRSSITAAGHVYDSTRVATYSFAIGRIVGSATTLFLSAATLPGIVTPGTSTLTSTLTLGNLQGANSATQTVDFIVANVGTPSGISETSIEVEYLYGQANGASPLIVWSAL